MDKSKLFTISFFTTTSILLSGCAGVVVVGATTGAVIAHDRRAPTTLVDDQVIEFRIRSRLADEAALRKHANISITSYNNIVLLTGEVPTEEMRRRAEEVTRAVPKVRRVHNELTVSTVSAPSARLRDSLITAKAKTSLFKVKKEGFDPTRIKVVTENRSIFLMGLVRVDEADAAVQQVSQVNGVTKVVKVFEYLAAAPL